MLFHTRKRVQMMTTDIAGENCVDKSLMPLKITWKIIILNHKIKIQPTCFKTTIPSDSRKSLSSSVSSTQILSPGFGSGSFLIFAFKGVVVVLKLGLALSSSTIFCSAGVRGIFLVILRPPFFALFWREMGGASGFGCGEGSSPVSGFGLQLELTNSVDCKIRYLMLCALRFLLDDVLIGSKGAVSVISRAGCKIKVRMVGKMLFKTQ